MSFKLSDRSIGYMDGVHTDLVNVVRAAIIITTTDFGVTEGLRSFRRQVKLVEEGKSHTLDSRHLTGHAVDLVAWVGGKVSWNAKDYEPIAEAMKNAAKSLRVDLEWGGDWKSFKDCPHFQLSRKSYKSRVV